MGKIIAVFVVLLVLIGGGVAAYVFWPTPGAKVAYKGGARAVTSYPPGVPYADRFEKNEVLVSNPPVDFESRAMELGFEVVGMDLVGPDGLPARDHEQVSSTFIRRALSRGDMERANSMLGRPYEVRGMVGRGDRRGRELGFPTANVRVDPSILLPEDGVYAGWYERENGAVFPAAISLGTRPQFYEDGALLLEAHLLDVGGPDSGGPDLYDEIARVRFVGRLRGQRRFDGLDSLVDQLHRDVADTRSALV